MTTKDGRKRRALQRGASALVALSLANGLAHAQAPQPGGMPSGMAAVSVALGHMKTGGVPLVVVVTSSAKPESRAFCRALFDGPWARANRGLVQIVELPAEGNAATIERLKVTSLPSVLAYTASPEGPLCRGIKAGSSPDEVTAWLGSFGIGDTQVASGILDQAVTPAMHDGYPSAQQPYTAPPPPVQAPPSYSYTPTYAAPPAPTYYAPAPVMAAPQPAASYVQLPGPNVVVQQGQPQVFVTQAAPQPSFAAQPSYGAQPMASNMYLPTAAAPPPVSYAAQPAPVAYAAQPAPMAYAAQPAPAAAYAAAPVPYAAVTNQTMALPTSGSRTRIRVRGPGPIRSGLASLGEKLTLLGRSRIETVQETDLNTPAVQGGGGVATLATTSAMPVGAPHMQTAFVPQPVAAPPQQPVYESSPPVTPTPQGAPAKHGHFFKKLADHD